MVCICQDKNTRFLYLGDNLTTANRVKLLIQQKKLTQKKFAESIGISPARLNNYFAGLSSIPPDILVSVSNVYNVDLNWLLTGEGDMYINDRAREDSNLLRLPIAGLIAAGAPTELVPDEETQYIEVSRKLLSLPPPYYVFQVDGESMLPLIYPDDYVIISRNWRGIKLNKRICAFRDCDGITLKQYVLDHKHKTAWLWPLNSTYNPLQYNQDTPELTLIGVLVLSIRKYT